MGSFRRIEKYLATQGSETSAPWGIGAWIVSSEMFSLQMRLALSVATNWLFNWALGYAMPYLVDSDPGNAGFGAKIFFLWGSSCFVGFAFTYFFICETKGLGLEEVDELFKTVRSVKDSVSFVPVAVQAADDGSVDKRGNSVEPQVVLSEGEKSFVSQRVD